MHLKQLGFSLFAICFILLCSRVFASEGGVDVVPKPEQVTVHEGSFLLGPTTQILFESSSRKTPFPIEYFISRLTRASGYPLRAAKRLNRLNGGIISFGFAQDARLGPEGYRLDIGRDSIRVEAESDAGLFYAVQTLLQMLPIAAFDSTITSSVQWRIPCSTIIDRPRFAWRGMMLDVSRHFFPKEFIKTCIDMLAMHKMNTFHWHLTDDQGWRIEIKKYPRLTRIGSWRVDREDRNWSDREPQHEGERATYGGFYSQNDVREIVNYALQRNVTIVPEIEMPAHTQAALAACPEFSCTGGPFNVLPGGVWPITEIYCAGNDSTFAFLQDVLSEVLDLFPGKYVHIGGDEADKAEWKKCPKCQARIKQEGLKDEGELQSYFVKRIEKFLVSKSRRLIGWDEILEGGLAPEATVMSWRGVDGGIASAKLGHDVVMVPGSYCYLSTVQGNPEYEPPSGGGYLPLTKVYAFEPVPDTLSAEEAKHVLGGEAALWTENVTTPDHAEYMLLPRLAALAEVFWSPTASRNWNDFITRMEHMIKRYGATNYNYARSQNVVSILPSVDTQNKRILVTLITETAATDIRYTLDGSEPSAGSLRYTGPFAVESTLTVKAASLLDGKAAGPVAHNRIYIHKGLFKPVTLKYPHGKYSGGGDFALTNGIRGTKLYDDGNWQGFEHDDLDATIDLGRILRLQG